MTVVNSSNKIGIPKVGVNDRQQKSKYNQYEELKKTVNEELWQILIKESKNDSLNPI